MWLWIGLALLAACETSTRIRGTSQDGGLDGPGGSAGTGSVDSSAGDAGTGGGAPLDAGADSTDGADGSTAEGGGCVPSDVVIDFAALGNVDVPRFEQEGVAVVGIA